MSDDVRWVVQTNELQERDLPYHECSDRVTGTVYTFNKSLALTAISVILKLIRLKSNALIRQLAFFVLKIQ